MNLPCDKNYQHPFRRGMVIWHYRSPTMANMVFHSLMCLLFPWIRIPGANVCSYSLKGIIFEISIYQKVAGNWVSLNFQSASWTIKRFIKPINWIFKYNEHKCNRHLRKRLHSFTVISSSIIPLMLPSEDATIPSIIIWLIPSGSCTNAHCHLLIDWKSQPLYAWNGTICE